MTMRLCAIPSLIVAACALLATSTPAQQQPVRRLLVAPSASEARVPLEESARGHRARAEALGELPGDTELLSMSLVLKPSPQQDAALTQLLADQTNPASASYRQWLTPEQFGKRFGAAEADVALIDQWLQSSGFTVQSTPSSQNRIVFSGTAATAERAFRTSLRRYRRNGREFFENSDAVQLPASLTAVVGGVTGLSSYRPATPQVRRSAAVTASPDYTTSTSSHYLVPWDLRQIYGTNTLIGSGYDGTGIKIGIIGQSAVDTTQLTYFQQKTGQTLNLPNMVLVPKTGSSNRVSGDEGESELDLEYSGGNAPGASVQFIYTGCTTVTSSSVLSASTNCNNNGVFDALAWAVTNNLAPILSLSYGGCEEEDATYANNTLEPLLRQANSQGQTIMVSSGDSGAAGCETSASATVATAGLAVSYPASSAYVTAVGGTQLTSDGSSYWSSTNNSYLGSAIGYVPETSWNDTAHYNGGVFSSSSGGASKLFPKPSWQVGTGVPADAHRDVPDVAFPANVLEYAYLTCDADGPCTSGTKSFSPTGTPHDGGGVGGTSAAAPTFAGMLAIVEQANGGKALGNVNPSLYALAQGTSASSIFHDITTGSNIVNCTVGTPDCTTGTLGYNAGVGYDLVTGLGSIAIPALQTALASYAANVPKIQLAVPTAVSAGTPVTFTATLTGSGAAPTGTVTFSVDGSVVGSAQALLSGTASYNYAGFTSATTHTVSAAYSGDGTYTAGSASVVVTASSVLPTITLSVTPANPSVNTPVTLTATLTSSAGSPTGTVLLSAPDISQSGSVALVNGTATFTLNGYSVAGLHTVTAQYTPSGVYQVANASASVIVGNTAQIQKPTVQLTASPASVAPGANITYLAQVTGSGPLPTGNVQFVVDGVVKGASLLQSGAVSFAPFAPLTSGSHTVQANYYGDNTYLSGSATAVFTVVNPGTGVSVSPGTLTATYGSTATGTVTVTSTASAGGTTSFTLSLVSSTGAAFSGCYGLSSRTLSLPANGTASGTLTMYTTASSCTTAGRLPLATESAKTPATLGGNGVPRAAWAVLPLPLLLLLLRRRRVPGALFAMLSLSCLLALSGCGSGGSSSNTGTTTTPPTTGAPTTTTSANSGTYVIRVAASTATASGTLTSSTTFTLNVQ